MSNDFDPQDVIAVEPQRPVAASGGSDFDPKDVLQVTSPREAAQQDFHPQDVIAFQKPQEDPGYEDVKKTLDRSFWKAPLVGTEETKDNELEAIAHHHGIDPEALKEAATWMGAHREGGKSPAGEELESALGRGIGGGLPQFLAKKLGTDDENFRKALDDVRELGNQKRSFAQGIAENLLPIGASARFAKEAVAGVKAGTATLAKTAGRLAESAGVGAGYGLASSSEGTEGKSTSTGAAFGLGLGIAGESLGHFLQGRVSPEKAEELLSSTPKNQQLDILKATESEAAKTQKADAVLQDLLTGKKDAITPEEASIIVKEHLGDDVLEAHLNPETTEGSLLKESLNVDQVHPDQAIEHLANQVIDQKAKAFAESLTGVAQKDAEKAIEDIEKFGRQGQGYLEDRFQDFRKQQAFDRGVEEVGLRASSPMGTAASIGMKMSASEFPLRLIDEKFGTRAEAALGELNNGRNKLSFPRTKFREDLDHLNQMALKSPDAEAAVRGGQLADAIEGGAEQLKTLDPTQQEVAGAFQDFFARVRSFANGGVKLQDPQLRQLNIPKLEDYIPHIALPVPELVAKVEQRLEAAVKDASKVAGRDLTSLQELSAKEWKQAQQLPAVKDLIAFRNWRSPHENVPVSGGKLQAEVLDSIRSRSGRIELDKVARASQERTGEIPNWIREKNLYQLADRYTHDVLTNLYQRSALDKLRLTADKLDKVGAEKEADFVRNIVTDTLGVRKGTAAEAYKNILVETARMLDSKIEAASGHPVQQLALKSLKQLPLLPQYMARAIYPNVLGWNIRAITQNLVSGVSRTAPELGTRYGYQTYARALVYGIANKAEMLERIKQFGHAPDEIIRSGERALSDGIRDSALVSFTTKQIDALGKVSMALFETSEKLNRISILSTARLMARDVEAGVPAAIGSLQRFPYTIRRAVLQARGNPGAAEQILGRYLMDTTAFQYSRPSMFEFGRTMGPLFSTFSKWPTAMLGEALYDLQSKGLVKGGGRVAERLMPPLLAFMGIDQMLRRSGESDRRDKALGKGGLAEAAPVNSLLGLSKGNLFTPPIISAVAKGLVAPAGKGDASGIGRGIDQMAFSFIPGAGTIKFLTDDMATYITGRKPEGSMEIQRVIEGAKALNRKIK